VRSIIRKILLESVEPQKIEVGDIFFITETNNLIMVTNIIQDGKPGIKSVQTMWGTKQYESEGYSLKYKVSLNNGKTWAYEDVGEENHDGEGHYVDTGWIGELVKMGYWSLLQKNINFFDSLTESEEEFDWLPTQNEIGLKVRVDGKPFYIENYYHQQDEGMFTSKVGGWSDCYEIIDEKVFNNIDCYIVKFNDHYPKVYFRKQDFVEKDFCNPQMNESEDEFGWATDIVKEQPIKLGDVFYVVDSNFGGDQHPMNHKPEDVRYLLFVTDIYEENGGLMIEYKNCDRKGISYNPKDYNPTNPRCHYDDGDGYYNYVKYDDALNLVDERYWRPMGNNGYYNHLTESEDDFGWAENLVTEPFHLQLIRDNPRKPVRLEDVRYIMFNPSVEVGDKRFNKIAYFLEDNDYYPETLEYFGKKTSYIEITKWIKRTINVRQNGRWNIGPELSEQELYNFSQTENNGKYWAEESSFRFF
jgi:hypothetical protein